MKRLSKKMIVLRATGATAMMITFSGAAFSLAYWSTSQVFNLTESEWPEYGRQMLNWFLGILIIALTAVLVGWITRPRQIAVWNEMKDALMRIAKGDFDVALNQNNRYEGQIGEFVESINHMAQELKQVELLRQEFISNVSHEIQSPLTSIRGFAAALRNDELPLEERKHYLSIIETEATRLSKLSDNLLKLTSLESDHHPFEPRSYRLDKQLRELVQACEPQWMEKGLEIELELPKTTIVADEDLLSQVWVNLLHNAIKFTPAGGCLKVTLELGQRQGREVDHVTVTVKDSGIGMSPEDQKRIFERFYKGDKSRTRTTAGSGLGLSIAKKIVELHHGDIRVDSRLSAGSAFMVTMPLIPLAGEA